MKVIIIIIVFLMISIILYLIKIKTSKTGFIYNTDPTLISLKKEESKITCGTTKTSCNPLDPNSCSNCSDNVEMKCINLNNYNPPNKISNNSFCAPALPLSSCNTKTGGIYTWNGFAFSENQTWGCTCLWPDYFTGDKCDEPNPNFCTGGTIQSGITPSNDSCSCPENTIKMIRGNNNVAYCASLEGGGEFGLAGTLYPSPDWRNVMFRPINSQTALPIDLLSWSNLISQELNPQKITEDCTNSSSLGCNIYTLLQNEEKVSNNTIYVLNNESPIFMADRICTTALSYNGTCSKLCTNNKAVNYSTQYPTVQYTFYQGDYMSPQTC